MNNTRTLAILFAIGLLSLLVVGCGGSEDSSSETTTAPPAVTVPTTPTEGTPSGKGGGEDQAGAEKAAGSKSSTDSKGSDAGSGDGGAAKQKPASLATDPGSIPRAIVTAKGAVQTLPPSDAAQAQAMENSYVSIKAFGAESSGSEATDITYALVQYLTAKADGDWATTCARLYSVLRDNLLKLGEKSNDPAVKEGGCPAAYGDLMKNAPKATAEVAAEVDIASIRRGDDNRAFVIYKTPDTLSADMPMYEEDGIWTVGALEAYALTPAQLGESQEREQQ